jgi:hypothetical protein
MTVASIVTPCHDVAHVAYQISQFVGRLGCLLCCGHNHSAVPWWLHDGYLKDILATVSDYRDHA